ncbi:MAG: hypothetical protein ACR2LH_04670 [Thermoleophilaceae bacterium]
MSDDPEHSRPMSSQRPGGGLLAVRYGIPAVLLLAGLVVLFVGGEGINLEGWALFTGAGLAVLLLNVLHRAGVSGDAERDHEEEARTFFDSHGHWPDERRGEDPARAEDSGTDGAPRRLEQPDPPPAPGTVRGRAPIESRPAESRPARLPRHKRRRGH